jgi:hypothetical protein
MSFSGEAYIKKLNEEEDSRQAKKRLVSDCCMADVEPCRTRASHECPPQPFYICLKCERKCDVLTMDLSEEEE